MTGIEDNAEVNTETGSETRSVACTCDEAIHNDKFWAMLQVLEGCAHVLRSLLTWAEQCPCHGHLYSSLPMVAAVDADLAKALQQQWSQCPLRGDRAAELSSGAFFDELRRLCAFTSAHISQTFARFACVGHTTSAS
eukprot:6456587-Amphidinium_carterae.1